MSREEILTLVVTSLCVISLSIVFTLFYVHYYRGSIKSIAQGRQDIDIIDNNIDEQLKAKSKKHKIFVILIKTISYVFTGLVLGVFVLSVINRISGGSIVVGENSIIVVETGSMSYKNEVNTYLENYDNQFQAFDIIGITKKEKEDINLYDVIAFRNDEGNIIIHRIIEIDGNNYITRGDANDQSDSWDTTYEDIIGVYNGFNIPLMGIFIIFLQSNSGIVTVIAIMYCLILFGILQDKIDKKLEQRTKELMNVIDVDLEHKDVSHDFIERIYYRGYVYQFNAEKFIGKEAIKEDDEHKPSNKGEVVTVIKTSDDNIQIKLGNIDHAQEEEENIK